MKKNKIPEEQMVPRITRPKTFKDGPIEVIMSKDNKTISMPELSKELQDEASRAEKQREGLSSIPINKEGKGNIKFSISSELNSKLVIK